MPRNRLSIQKFTLIKPATLHTEIIPTLNNRAHDNTQGLMLLLVVKPR